MGRFVHEFQVGQRTAVGMIMCPLRPVAEPPTSRAGVSAIAVRTALALLSIRVTPATVVIGAYVARLVINLGQALLARHPVKAARAGARARQAAPAVDLAVGGWLGAACETVACPWSLLVPTGLALVALALAVPSDKRRQL